MVKFLSEKKIVEDLSPPFTSQLNGVAERFNRTIKNCTRALLIDSGFPKRLWAYAINYATMTYNILPKVACKGHVPYVMMIQKMPSLKFLCKFGCVVYETLPKKVSKFSNRALRKYFVGLTNNSALLLDVNSGTIKLASNVHFSKLQVYRHQNGPFEKTKFHDPLKLGRDVKDVFSSEDDYYEPEPKKLKQHNNFFYNPPVDPNLNCLASSYETSNRQLPMLHETCHDFTPIQIYDLQFLVPSGPKSNVLLCHYYLHESLDSHL